ncbi:protein kintoun [Pelodiscus sinensis]|uniref:protein kintoun n=1 Tax=Pelodiscus sinensis TaxID=13735 RepID=UPI003F6B196A
MAAAGRSGLEELQLTGEEVERLKGAFRDERFRALLAEYAAELADPAQRRRYEEEVAALERERGVQVRFVHPAPGYVLRTSQGGAQRCYLNVCSNPLLGRPEARAEPGGQRWSLPYCLAPGREELGRAGRRRLLYDVVFHPDTLRLAARSARFRRMVSDTALEAVQGRFGVRLDRANAAPLRGTAYKGVPQAAVLRTPLPGGAPPPAEPASPLPPFPSPYAYPPAPPGPAPAPAARPPSPTTPRWSLRHRSHVDLLDYRCCRDSAPSPVPRELVVAIELPLLSAAAQAALEIRGRELRLDSQRPAYRLRLRLPYAVDESRGRAAFHKATRQLLVTLPVVAPSPGEREHGPVSSADRGEAGPAVGGEEGELRLPPPTEEACAPGLSGRAPAVTAERPSSTDLTTGTPSSSKADHSPRAPSSGADLPISTSSTDLSTGTPSSSEADHPPRAPSSGADLPISTSSTDLTTGTPSSSEADHPPRAPSSGADLPISTSSTDLTTGTPRSSEADHPPRAPSSGADLPISTSSTDLTTGTPRSSEADHPPRAPSSGADLPISTSSMDLTTGTPRSSEADHPPQAPSSGADLPISTSSMDLTTGTPRSSEADHPPQAPSSGADLPISTSSMDLTTGTPRSSEADHPPQAPSSGADLPISTSSTDLSTGTPRSSEADHPPRAPSSGADLPISTSSTDLTTGTPCSSEADHPPWAPSSGADLHTCSGSTDLSTGTPSSSEADHPPRAPSSGADLPISTSSMDLTTGTPSSSEADHPPRAPSSGADLHTCSGSMDLTTGTPSSSEADHPPWAPNSGADLPTCPSSSLYPAVPTNSLRSTAEPPSSCSSQQDLPVAPSISAAPICPPFQCTQDEESLTLLLQVPNIRSESLKGEVDTNHYRLSFCSKDAASYSFLLQFSVENKLAPPETDINVSPNNAVIGLAKSPESAGLWRKMYFGLDSNTLQERLFVSEENIDEFLDNVLCPSFLNQSTLESQPLIEVLDVTEVKSQIILKSQEVTHCELGEKEQMVNNSGRDQLEKENRNYFKTNLEANLSAADTVGKHSTETDMISGHCLQLEPTDTNLAISGKSQIDDPHLELAFTTGKSATSSDSEKQELLHLEEQAKIRKDEEVLSSEPAEENRHLNCKPVPPIIEEINRQDGSVKIVKDHTTHCGLIFQNSLLYELD